MPFEDGEIGEQLLEGVLGPSTEAAQALKRGREVRKAGGARGGRGRGRGRGGEVVTERGGRGRKRSLMGCGDRRRRRGAA